MNATIYLILNDFLLDSVELLHIFHLFLSSDLIFVNSIKTLNLENILIFKVESSKHSSNLERILLFFLVKQQQLKL